MSATKRPHSQNAALHPTALSCATRVRRPHVTDRPPKPNSVYAVSDGGDARRPEMTAQRCRSAAARAAAGVSSSAGHPRRALDQCRRADGPADERPANLQRPSRAVSRLGFDVRPSAARHRRDRRDAGRTAMSRPSATASTPPACLASPTSTASRRSAAFPPGSRCRRIRISRPAGAGISCSPGFSSSTASSISAFGLVSGAVAAPPDPDRRRTRRIAAVAARASDAAFPQGEAATRYNVIQKLTYLIVVLGLLPLQILAGLAMSPGIERLRALAAGGCSAAGRARAPCISSSRRCWCCSCSCIW